MGLRDRLNDDLKAAMKSRDQTRMATLRLVICALKDRDIAARGEDRCGVEDEGEVLALLAKMIRQREESSKTYEEGGRPDLAEREREEMEIIRAYLPEQLGDDEIARAAADVVTELRADGLKDMGRCMGALKSRYSGRMDFGKAGAVVKGMLAQA